MTAPEATLRWWPVVALPALVLLGWAVGEHSTALDDVFFAFGADHRAVRRALLTFTWPVLIVAIYLITAGWAAVRRRGRTAVLVLAAPVVGLILMRLLKRLFGRTRGGVLAYPSGHVTVTVIVLGMAALVCGATWWAWTAAFCWWALAAVGQAISYHYFTDTVGALLLATSVLAVVIRVEGAGRPPAAGPGTA